MFLSRTETSYSLLFKGTAFAILQAMLVHYKIGIVYQDSVGISFAR